MIFGVLEVSFWALTTVVKLPRKFLTLIYYEIVITVWTVVQTVLTATFNSYGNRQISSPITTTSIPLNRSTKNRHNWLHPRGDLLYQIWQKSNHWGLVGKWVKYNKNYFYLFIYTFFSLISLQVRPVDGFLRAIAQKTWNHAMMCLFGVWTMCP